MRRDYHCLHCSDTFNLHDNQVLSEFCEHYRQKHPAEYAKFKEKQSERKALTLSIQKEFGNLSRALGFS